jgi:hypothetical protein
MKTRKLMVRVLGLVVLFTIAAASAADAPKLTFNFTKANVPGADQTYVSAINNQDVMVGQYQDKKGSLHGYILNGKKLTTVDDPKGTNTAVSGINFNGAINVVGFYLNSSGSPVGFRYTPKTKQFTDIPGPKGALSLYTGGMNDQGWIVGDYKDSSGVYHGFLLKGKKYTILDVPGAADTYALGINNKGSITLYWANSKFDYAGALTKDFGKTYETINVPGAGRFGSEAAFINNEGDVTLWWFDSSGVVHGALCTECESKELRKYYKFDYPKAPGTFPNGINDQDAFVGWYQTEDGSYSGFKATFK